MNDLYQKTKKSGLDGSNQIKIKTKKYSKIQINNKDDSVDNLNMNILNLKLLWN